MVAGIGRTVAYFRVRYNDDSNFSRELFHDQLTILTLAYMMCRLVLSPRDLDLSRAHDRRDFRLSAHVASIIQWLLARDSHGFHS